MTCDLCRSAIVERWTPGAAVPEEASAHLENCRDCGSWFAAFADGLALSAADGDALAATVIERTTGGACGRVRDLLAGRPDSPLADIDVDLVGLHLASCAPCSELSTALDAVQAGLASLETLDPGPGFADRVIARTSRKASRPTLAERWRAAWGHVVSRPRLAWEVAYVATVCWLVFFGPSLSALEWTTAKVATVARGHVPSRLDALGDALNEWRAAVTAELGTTSATIEARRVSWAESAAIEFEKRVAWTQQAAAALLDGLENAVRATATWLGEFLRGLAAEPTEPAEDAARSRQ